MLESLTIFSTGGLIHYQYQANPSLLSDGPNTKDALNEFLIRPILCDPARNATTFYHIAGRLTFCWTVVSADEAKSSSSSLFYIVAIYPDILLEAPRQYLKEWCQQLVQTVSREYMLYYNNMVCTNKMTETTTNQNKTKATSVLPRPSPEAFDPIFQLLLQQSKGMGVIQNESLIDTKTNSMTTTTTAARNKNHTGGKVKRHWQDGNAKITQKVMDELDFSEEITNQVNDQEQKRHAMERALMEARQAYLPSSDDLLEQQQQQEQITQTDISTWSTSITGMLQQMVGTKVLTESDIEKPLQTLQEMLTSQNVVTNIAQQLVESCRAKLIGKKLQSLYRVQTAIQQALEAVVTRMLEQRKVDLLRLVQKKKTSSSAISLFGGKQQQRPFVIVIMGINGIGKTTTIAKLAYYFQQHGCRPLLAAADTFRSGAVEQLQVHAECLQVPIFAQGYAKDPSTVAAAAIQQATAQGNHVVLVDTAGRMQNNVSLMKAMTKLIQENQPDFCLLVCEALVGHDGLDQYQLFAKAAGKIDGLILTKMDTVGSKVGAALTLTQQTGTPIVFCGTGQKYHHLQELSVPQVVQSLLSKS